MKKRSRTFNISKMILQCLDTLVFPAILSMWILLLFHIKRQSFNIFCIYASVLISTILLRRYLVSKRNQRSAKEEEKNRSVERLLLMRDETINDALGFDSFFLIRKQSPTSFDVLEAIRQKTAAIGILFHIPETDDLIRRYAPNTTVIEKEELLYRVFHISNGANKEGGFPYLLLQAGVNKYLLLGIVLFGLSFFVNTKIYYRALSSLCLIIAPFAGILSNRINNKNLRIFLDKMGDR